MAITGQISLARAGQTVQVFQNVSDLGAIFDSNSTPSLQNFDHITLYPGDFTGIETIEIPETPEVYLTILPGAKVDYTFRLDEINRADRIEERYEDFTGAVRNIADLNIAHLYETTVEKQLSRVRRYLPGESEVPEPFVEYNNLDDAAEDASSGETIVVFPGNYNPQNNLLVDGVDWKFLSGAEVTFSPETFEGYPYALFDDSKTPTGESKGSKANASIFGNGEFIIGRAFQNATKTADTNSDWEGWHKYCLLAASNSSSNIDFEADTVRLEQKIDAAVKYANASKLDVNIETLEFGPLNEASETVKTGTFSSVSEVPLPAFMVVNGHIGSSSENEQIDISIGEVVVEEGEEAPRESFPYLVSGTNPNSNNSFSGNVRVSAEKGKGLDLKRSIFFPESLDHGPKKLLIENSMVSGNISFAGSSFQNTRLIIKESEVRDESEAPLTVSGNGENIDIALSGAWLLSENATNSIKNETGDTNVTLKAYNNSFANLPIEDFKEILHDQINNVAWSEDVNSIR